MLVDEVGLFCLLTGVILMAYQIEDFYFMRQSQDQFKDYLFISRLNLSQHSRQSHSIVPQLKLSRSTWTRKAIRQKQNQQKLNSFHTFFTNNPQTHSNAITAPQKNKKYRSIMESTHQNNASCRTEKNKETPLNIHFTINRNIINLDNHQDLAKSGILLQKIEDGPQRLRSNKKSHDPRLFLKSLKIKDNLNLYKGNFNKFTKKEIVHRIKTKRLNITNDIDVSPWEQDTTRPFFA